MRLLELLQIVNERNVANIDELKQQVAGLSGRIRSPQNKKWFIKQALAYLLNKHEVASALEPEALPYVFTSGVPDWAVKATQSGDGLWLVTMDDDITAQFGQIIDWVNSLPSDKQLNMNLEQAKEHSDIWHQEFLKKKVGGGEDLENVKTVMEFPNGFKWVDLGSHACLSRESDIMGHCVGGEIDPKTNMRQADTSYWPMVEKGSTRILSLRDPKNNPHITVEIGAEYDEDEVEKKAVNQLAFDLGLIKAEQFGRLETGGLWKTITNKLGNKAEEEYTRYFVKNVPTPGKDDPWVINQIKGKANQKPKPEYQPYLIKLLNNLNMKVVKDRHHIDAVKKSDDSGYIDLDELQSGQDLHFEGTLKIVKKKGTYELGDVSSRSTGSSRGGISLGGSGSLWITGTDVRSIKNVDVGIMELRKVPDLTFDGEIVRTKDADTESSVSLAIIDSNVTFGPSIRGLDYNGLEISRSTVLNMPKFITKSNTARSSVTIENSIVEFPEVTSYMDNEDTWGSLGMKVFFKYSKVKLPLTLGAIDMIAFHGAEVSLKSVEWLNLQNDNSQLVITGTKIDGLPKKLKAESIVTDQPDQVASLITDNMEVKYIKDGYGKLKYTISKKGDRNVVHKVEKKAG